MTEPEQLEALRLDAARYRWLRDHSVPPHNFYISVPDEFHGVKYSPGEVDSYIDAAISANGGEAMTDTREALEEAFERLFCRDEQSSLRWNDVCAQARFHRFLDAEAWTDAAMMLVPEGFDWSMDNFDGELGKPSAWICNEGPFFNGTAETPALALAQACLKAKEQADG